jgi:TRAP-type uncharacterized transport system fused permease subunit
VDTSRVSFGELIAGIAGAVLFISLFLDWIDSDFGSASGWESFDVVDVILAVIGLSALALVLVRAAGTTLNLPAPPGLIVAADGAIATIIVLVFLLEGDDRGIGLFLAFLAALAIAFGGYTSMQERAGGGAPRATPGPPPPPPPQA